eukprot:TRINITY_DN728_c4_g1_i1.p1 TRINITY_DN728_c4_g1~~TRINITY_DN728_c4_g1_i1.p1  ORF type:complete len:242 (-),score=68.35 TRINITY_DN728_c4_g1_i1:50-745(-)
MTTTQGFTVAYWQIRGLAAPLRMMCEYTNTPYNNVTYTPAESHKWFKEAKPQLLEKNPLINLPYILDGDKVITQSNSCLEYLGRKFNLNGNSEEEQLKNNQCLNQVMDMRNAAVGLFYKSEQEFNIEKDKYCQNVLNHYNKFEKWLEVNKTNYLSANEPRTADFHLFEMLDQHERFAKDLSKPSFLEKYPNLKQFHHRFSQLPGIQKYSNTEVARYNCNNTSASWQGKPSQ